MSAGATRTRSLFLGAVAPLGLLLLLMLNTRAERLPVKTYTTADGLLRDEVNRIKQDSRGFLWFCTNDGLSRFDGYGFTNYTTDDGLPHRVVNDILETRGGVIWIATENGLARFNPRGKRGPSDTVRDPQSSIRNPDEPMFVTYSPEENNSRNVLVLFEDAQRKLWCGTGDGIYWLKRDRGVFHRVDLPKERPNVGLQVSAIIQDRRGNLWVGMDEGQGLNRILPDGRIEHYPVRHDLYVKALLETRDGKIWAGTGLGLCSLVAEPDPNRAIFSHCYTRIEGLPNNWIRTLHQTSDGELWIGTTNGTVSFDANSPTSPQFRTYGEAQGLCDLNIYSLLEDRDGNVWVATSCGVKKVLRSSFIGYTEDDGLKESLHVTSIFVSHAGELFVITKQIVESKDKKNLRAIHLINRFDGNRFTSFTPNLPTTVGTGWGTGQIVVQDKAGQWWLPSDKKAAYRFPKVGRLEQLSSVQPEAIGISDDEVFRLYEDSRGDIWIGTMYVARILKWERNAEALHDYTDEMLKLADKHSGFHTTCFSEDRSGSLWMSFYGNDRLARYRNGRFTVLPTNGEKSGGAINSLYFDSAGRLWLASTLNGVGRIDDPNTEQLKIVWYGRRKGLATDSTLSLTEDNFGRIYVGHARGVDRIDPNTEQIKHYTAADGLPQGIIQCTARDKQGGLWFSGRGLTRLIPEPDRPRLPPNILLTGLRIAGEKQSVSELGEETFPELTLEPPQRQVSVDFLGLGASLGEELKYQYRLEGARNDWSEPTTQRTVDFANLSPGTYRLLVKAITAEGIESARPAVFAFTVLPPVWQRWWFLTLAVIVVSAVIYSLYRYRVSRLVEIERVRTRIATDLHDDIGANLSLIATVSEVVRLRSREDDAQTRESLSLISDTSRELVDAMGDIVWAVNPGKDHLRDLRKKMRRFASDVFSARNITLRFQAPDDEHDMKLGTDTRREVFLIFKEGVNNIARHSNCTEAGVELQARGGWLVLKLSDNGKGFDTRQANDGSGLASMRKRAARLGGRLEIASDGSGTTVILKAPLGRRSRK
ncbi:MAG: two-component regulator propeller domain-containing protein [Acidobacteriota bacterium]